MVPLMESLLNVDTLLNVMVFVFIGLMVWLYFKDTPPTDPSEP